MGAARTPIALVEREVELARIAGRLAQSRSGEGALIVVDGPAGIGKTSLLRALGGQAAADGMQVLHARGSELETGFAFGVLRMALAPALAALDPAARTEVTAGQAAHALAMLEPGDADGAPEAVLHGVYWLIANLAEYGPLVLLVDDAQWADSPSIDGLSFLARRVEQLPVALVVATRPPDPDVSPVLAALAADPSAEVLRPMPLGDWGIAELAGTADADFVAAAAAATGGNPFLVDQLLRELGPERTPRAVAAVDPRHLARVVLARVSDDARALARALAVIGDGAGLRECGALGCVADAEAAAGELARAGLIGEDELRFRHPLLAAAVEADLGGVRRSAWHGRAAAALHATGAEPERIALHLTKTEPAGNAESARTLWRAAGAARARGAPTTAAGLLRRALLEPPAAEERVAVSLDLGHVLALLGDPTAAAVLLEVARTAEDPALRVEALTTGTSVAELHETAEQIAVLDAAIAEVPADRPDLRLRLESARLSVAGMDLAEMGEGIERATALGLFEDSADTTPDLLGHLAWWQAATGEPAGRCGPIAERAVELGRREATAMPFRVWYPLTLLVLRCAERLDAALRLVDFSERAALDRGSSAWYALTRLTRSQVERTRGNLLTAEADAVAATEASEAAGTTGWMRALPSAGLIHTLVDRGRIDAAQDTLERLGIGEAIPDDPAFAELVLARGALRHERGELDGAMRDLEQAERCLAGSGPPSILTQDARLRRALIAHALGDQAAAAALARQALDIADRWGTPGAIGSALRVRGLVEDDADALISGVARLAESPLRVVHAHALADLGAALRRSNARAEAREPLREALAIARDSGADGLAARVEAELEATGLRVPPRPGGGAASLTPSEARIAQMAADGLSNKQIAQSLFVTVKTVEMHLGNAYRKLDVGSRRELPAALAAPNPGSIPGSSP